MLLFFHGIIVRAINPSQRWDDHDYLGRRNLDNNEHFFAYYLRDLVPQQKQRGTTSSKLLNLVFEATTLAVFVVIPLRKSEWFGIYELNSTDRTKVLLVAKPRKLYCLPRDVRFTQYHHNQGWKIDPPHWDTHEGIYSFNPSIFITPHKHP